MDPFDSRPESVDWDQLAELRERSATEIDNGMYVIARYAEAAAAFRNGGGKNPHFSHAAGMRADSAADGPADEQLMSEIDGPRHADVRRLLMMALQPRLVARAEPQIRQIAHRLLDDLASTAEADLVEHFAAPIPAFVMAHLLGLPDSDVPQFQQWADEVVAGQYESSANQGFAAAHPDFSAYLDRLIHDRSTTPQADFLTHLVQAQSAGVRFSPGEIRTLIMHLIVAGSETTRHLISNVIYRLITTPGWYARVRRDRDLVVPAIEESLRLDPPVLMRAVTCVQDVTGCDAAVIPSGTRVIISIAAANRDPAVFVDADAFAPDRARPAHLAFGGGAHFCPGAQLARLEAAVSLDVFLDRVAAPTIEGTWAPRKVPVFWANGPRSLPVALRS